MVDSDSIWFHNNRNQSIIWINTQKMYSTFVWPRRFSAHSSKRGCLEHRRAPNEIFTTDLSKLLHLEGDTNSLFSMLIIFIIK